MSQILVDGARFGQYRVVRLLGLGGMGEVYEVEHRVLGTRHALKLLSDEVLDHEEVLDYFKNEGRVMAQLKHPGIVAVDEFGQTDGHYWLRMELIEGVATTSGKRLLTLHDYYWHLGGRLKEQEVAECMRQFLEAIGFVHEKGVVHRDLKPANILLDESGMKITDFGLVKVAAEDWHRNRIARSQSSGLRQPSSGVDLERDKPEVLGTFEYMSPEQKQGFADQRSDLYSVGLIGFQLLTGKERPSVKAPSRIVDGIHPGWDEWFANALENDPQDRFQTAVQMRAAIPGQSSGSKSKVVSGKFDKMKARPLPSHRPKPASKKDSDIDEDEIPPPRPRRRRRRGSKRPHRNPVATTMPWFIILLLLGVIGGWVVSEFLPGGRTSKPTELPSTPPSPKIAENPSTPGLLSPLENPTGMPVEGKDWTVPGLDLGMKWLAAGAFRMGSDPSEVGHEPKEAPAGYVILSKGFWLGATEVTVGQFRQFVDADRYLTSAESGHPVLSGSDWQPIASATWLGLSQSVDVNPVVGISWDDALSFCSWLTQNERAAGRLPVGLEYTLPSEAEWESSCRGGDPWDHPYGSGAQLDQSIANFGGDRAGPAPTGDLVASRGLHDMHGNVFEWCRGWYATNYTELKMTDPEGPTSGQFRPMRGGGWRSPATECRAAYRRGASSTHADDQTGFRIVLRKP